MHTALSNTHTAVTVVQIPYQPDPNLRGYVGGFSLGHHVYLTPHFNGVFFGKVRSLAQARASLITTCAHPFRAVYESTACSR